MNDNTKYRTVDLFSGAGGMSLGFETHGFTSVFSVDNNLACTETFGRHFTQAKVIHDDVCGISAHLPNDVDVVIGGPPCQGFSLLGRDRSEESRMELNVLWKSYLGVVMQTVPQAFVIENVIQFQESKQFNELLTLMREDKLLSQYGFNYGLLNAADYGVPQNRKRGFFMAVLGQDVSWPPTPTHGPDASLPHSTVRSAIADLPEGYTTFRPGVLPNGLQDLHMRRNFTAKSLERYKAIPPGGNRFDLLRNRPDITPECWQDKPSGSGDVMGRMWWNKPGPTIRTEFWKPEKGRYLHPVLNRPITHREAARIQSFPDDFYFEGTKIEIGKQIGNAVPPLLAEAVAKHLASHLTPRT